MDKYEYKVRSEEISHLIDKGKYIDAVGIADTIDWRRVKSVTMLLKIAALYRVNRRNEDSKEILLLAYEHYPTNRSVVYSLCELSIESDDVVAAIEYYKQFVKLAPKDSGVYTLRYRILEAQEASLEERIEILEELKRRDYQEEWGYELAYLYHRVGLATKCVEECDDIILWFGEGAYVMKAMELKALHAPLTEVQQAKYESMLGHAEDDYSEEGYPEEGYAGEDESAYDSTYYPPDSFHPEDDGMEPEQDPAYGQRYQGSGVEGFGMESQDMRGLGAERSYIEASDIEGSDIKGSDIEGSDIRGSDIRGSDTVGYPDGPDYGQEVYLGYDQQDYEQEAYPDQAYGETGYGQQDYGQETYPDQAYGEAGYDQQGYGQEAYPDQAYGEASYDQQSYVQQGYTESMYVGEDLSQDGYVDDGYGNLSYIGDTYQDIGGTGEIDLGADDAGPSYTDVQPCAYQQSSYPPPSKNSVDMSQYNTINLQKVVAESMKELFPDDDIFGKEKEKPGLAESIHSAEQPTENVQEIPEPDQGGVPMDTIVYMDRSVRKGILAGTEDPQVQEGTSEEPLFSEELSYSEEFTFSEDAEDPDLEIEKISDDGPAEEEDPADREDPALGVTTGRIARMVTGVRAAEPEPDTGAISKVLVPGEDARFIKVEPDMDELRGTTEESFSEELDRLLDNDENVYHTQDLLEMDEDGEGAQEEASADAPKKQPTGTMDLSEVLEEWERMKQDKAKEHQAEIKKHVLTQTGKILANFDDSIKSGVLEELEREEMDGTEEIDSIEEMEGSLPEVEDDLEGAVSDEGGSQKPYLSEFERVVAQELGGLTQDLPQADTAALIEPDAAQPESGDAEPDHIYPEDDRTQELPVMEDTSRRKDGSRPASRGDDRRTEDPGRYGKQRYAHKERRLDPEDEESIAEMAKEDALKTQEIKMSTADLSSLSEKIVAATKKEAKGAKREELRDFSPEEQELFENFAVTKKIKKQIVYALDNMTLAAYTGNIIITGDAGLDTVRMAKNLIKEYHAIDDNFSGKAAKITGEKLDQRNLKEVFDKLNNGGIIIEKANGMSERKLYEMASLLNQENLGIIVIMEDTKKEIARLLGKQAMIADYFNIRIDLMEMDINALVAYAKNYALALEYSIDELGTLALYTRIANMQSGNHVVTKDEVRDIVDEAIWKSKKSKLKNFVDVLFARRYDGEDMIVLKERDFM